jgi:hypothetical protein
LTFCTLFRDEMGGGKEEKNLRMRESSNPDDKQRNQGFCVVNKDELLGCHKIDD